VAIVGTRRPDAHSSPHAPCAGYYGNVSDRRFGGVCTSSTMTRFTPGTFANRWARSYMSSPCGTRPRRCTMPSWISVRTWRNRPSADRTWCTAASRLGFAGAETGSTVASGSGGSGGRSEMTMGGVRGTTSFGLFSNGNLARVPAGGAGGSGCSPRCQGFGGGPTSFEAHCGLPLCRAHCVALLPRAAPTPPRESAPKARRRWPEHSRPRSKGLTCDPAEGPAGQTRSVGNRPPGVSWLRNAHEPVRRRPTVKPGPSPGKIRREGDQELA